MAINLVASKILNLSTCNLSSCREKIKLQGVSESFWKCDIQIITHMKCPAGMADSVHLYKIFFCNKPR